MARVVHSHNESTVQRVSDCSIVELLRRVSLWLAYLLSVLVLESILERFYRLTDSKRKYMVDGSKHSRLTLLKFRS